MAPVPPPSAEGADGTGLRLTVRFLEVVTAFARIPLPGHGDTWERFQILASLAEEDLSLARLGEGHADALAILRESGREIRYPGSAYGVWAARSGSGGVTAKPVAGGWELAGRKPFCSGSGLIDRALITAEAPDGYRLFDVATADVVTDRIPGSWPAVGMADSQSETLIFGGRVSEDDAIGPPEFYTRRPGFWFGACGVAACWYGGARGMVAGAVESLSPEPAETTLMELGKAASSLQAMTDTLGSAAEAIDLDPEDKQGHARGRALAVREVVHSCCEAILGLTAAAGGARPLCHDAEQARRAADLYVYLAQHHGGPDAVRLGRLILEGRRWS
jgi:alkylation response protein AidB-like acyl-CoA dehydrogenase